ncbi:MAG: succinate dehydrogenase cytochrome b558 subunit [Acidobacteriota bacterium]|nr:succinate dehydrogenase cytochrome b558 subunit [Blastocatellia bacterium]MDW8411636.1 succinate dehydrogenase cytochrome b558 subunit [Acidobacteriota bacterium]
MSIKMSNIFLLRRLHSLTGVVPVGVFLIVHLYTNFAVVKGADNFNKAVQNLRVTLPGPLLPMAEILLIGLPILFHALLGIYIAHTMRSNVTSYSYARNWLYFFQRVAGVVLFFFIAAHVATMRFGLFGHLSVDHHVYDPVNTPYTIVRDALQNPFVLAFYIIGILASAYHLSYGLWSFAIHWGITVREEAQKNFQWVCAAVGVGVATLGVVSALTFVK